LVRMATEVEKSQIIADYKAQGASSIGVYISFKNYTRSDMVRLYSALEYYTVASLNKQSNLSSAIQFKMKGLRSSTGLVDKAEVKAQSLAMIYGLADGKDVLMDEGDKIETSSPDMSPVKESIEFLNEKRAFYLGLPKSYISGDQTGGIGSTGEGDVKAVERGLKAYFFSIIKPVFKALFEVDLAYKSQDFRMISQGLQALQTFNLDADGLLTPEQKQLIIHRLFDIEESEDDNL